MTREERLSILDKAKKLEMSLPENGETIGISVHIPAIILWGEFDFRKFAESMGAEVHGESFEENDITTHVTLHATLLGIDVSKIVCPTDTEYEAELQRCETQ